MRGEIAMHLHREVLALPLFTTACQGFLRAVAMNVEPLFCAPGEYIIHTADAIHAIYYVGSGSLEILKDGMVVAILGLFLGFSLSFPCSPFPPLRLRSRPRRWSNDLLKRSRIIIDGRFFKSA